MQDSKKQRSILKCLSFFERLPDEIFLIVLLYCDISSIHHTRMWQTKQVVQCTSTTFLAIAALNENLSNMLWIQQRLDFDDTMVTFYLIHVFIIIIINIVDNRCGTKSSCDGQYPNDEMDDR